MRHGRWPGPSTRDMAGVHGAVLPMADVAADVIAVIAGKVRGERPPIQLTDKLEDLGLESLDAVEMIFELEEKFDITIPYNANDSRTEFDTVGDVVRAVSGLVDGKA